MSAKQPSVTQPASRSYLLPSALLETPPVVGADDRESEIVYQVIQKPLHGGRRAAWRLVLEGRAGVATYRDVLDSWQTGDLLADTLTRQLVELPSPAFFWETPPITRSTLERPFECVVIDSPALARLAADPSPFSEHFAGSAATVTFPNLGGDAVLIAPVPTDDNQKRCGHLAAFLREAPAEAARALWAATSRAVARELADDPLWLSTSGLGVSWLHIRIDRRPKYYQHRPYRQMSL